MTIDEFVASNPQFGFDFAVPLRNQTRVTRLVDLLDLPDELAPREPYRPGGRGRPNYNQTRAHSQCATCHRVLRNDQFYTPDSLLVRNLVYPHCKQCTAQHNADYYQNPQSRPKPQRRPSTLRDIIQTYLTPRCILCGFDNHPSALDLHRLYGDDREIADIIDALALRPDVYMAERLLREAIKCVPLCSNCHRMLHAHVIALPSHIQPPAYNLAVLMRLISQYRDGTR